MEQDWRTFEDNERNQAIFTVTDVECTVDNAGEVLVETNW